MILVILTIWLCGCAAQMQESEMQRARAYAESFPGLSDSERAALAMRMLRA